MSRVWTLLSPLIASAALVSFGGCGGERRRTASAAEPTLSGIDTTRSPKTERGALITKTIPPGQSVRGDGDVDNPGDIDGNGDVDPEDGDSDYPTPDSYRFPDADDIAIVDYGHAADPIQSVDIARVAQRFFAAAVAGHGAAACALMRPAFARAIPEDYGGGAGPSYLRAGTTCPATMTLLFVHSREELGEPVKILGMRVDRHIAYVVVGSMKMRASYIQFEQAHGGWYVQQLFAQPLS